MKKLLSIVAVMSLLVLASCGGKPANPLVGKWKFVDMKMAQIDISSEVNKQTDGMSDTALGGAIDTVTKGLETMTNAMTNLGTSLAGAFMKGSIYEFKNDGTVSVKILFGSQDGSYSLTPDNKTLTMNTDGKGDQVFTVTKVDDKALEITTKDNVTWSFTRE